MSIGTRVDCMQDVDSQGRALPLNKEQREASRKWIVKEMSLTKADLVLDLTASLFLENGRSPIMFEDDTELCAEQLLSFCWDLAEKAIPRGAEDDGGDWDGAVDRLMDSWIKVLSLRSTDVEVLARLKTDELALFLPEAVARKLATPIMILNKQLDLMKLDRKDLLAQKHLK